MSCAFVWVFLGILLVTLACEHKSLSAYQGRWAIGTAIVGWLAALWAACVYSVDGVDAILPAGQPYPWTVVSDLVHHVSYQFNTLGGLIPYK